jgi:dihydrolipoamide dehydrogenase
MANRLTVRVPDIGDFDSVDVIEVLVAPGDRVELEAPLITLESDKATMEIPSPAAGVVAELQVAVDDQVSEGSPILVLEVAEAVVEDGGAAAAAAPPPAAPAPGPAPPDASDADLRAEVLVLGAGPGGYTAAFRAADLGKHVVLVEREATLGGVCLNVGCIPSKALLHVAEVVHEAAGLAAAGVAFGAPVFDFEKLRKHKNKAVGKLTQGLAQLAKQRGVEVVTGTGRFVSPHRVAVATAEGEKTIGFEHAIVAAGSRPIELGGMPDDPRIVDSTGALEVERVERLLVVGGGIIGLEMAAMYDALGTQVAVAELAPTLMPGTDPDLVRPLQRRIQKRYAGIQVSTRVSKVEAQDDGLRVHFEGAAAPEPAIFDRVLVAVGRRPNGDRIQVEAAGLALDAQGFLPTDAQGRTSVPHIFAIGDCKGQPMLAHKATHEGSVAAEAIAGLPAAFDAYIPSVAYTDPEVAWVGLTELEAEAAGTPVEKAVFPWIASGRALGIDRTEGTTKLLFDPETKRLLGAGIVGPSAGELIAELTLALELGADLEDIALTIHPHPTLSETVGLAGEVGLGTVTDLYLPKRRARKS